MARRGNVTVNIDARAISRMAEGPAGQALLRRRAAWVATYARIFSASNGSIPQGIYEGPVVGKTIKVISSNPHTVLVHNGSRPHLIRPRRGRYLRFEVGGRVVYAKLVRHPGFKGNPFLHDALVLSAG